ncbi:CdaR family transcriptional regulator [Alkalibacillus salilacus]|uniref:Carbohydrate diacid regulator n=1 Tax=Alkalibacillus salilacus TaxID=284582 RepID=A0ABT9VB16_9BACI|nr:sugar diacid recognition domain-containing protein [Alkalibacillus salilacus]MDQ0158133.1 carbohydrate diacid regulator [Alkalibacillus salilacus]
MRRVFLAGRLGESLVNEMRNLINEDVLITDPSGVVTASTDPERLGQFHEGALMAIENREKKVMTEHLTTVLSGVRKGVVLPILIEGEPIGGVGITGDPQLVSPYATLVQRVAELFISDALIKEAKEQYAREIDFFIFDWLRTNKSRIDLNEKAELLDVEMGLYERVIVIESYSNSMQFSYQDINLLKNLWNYGNNLIIARWGQNKLLFIVSNEDGDLSKDKLSFFKEQIESTFGDSFSLGVGQKSEIDLARSLEQAERANEISKKRGKVIFEEELRFDVLLYEIDSDVQCEFINRTIKPILEDEVLLESLEVWFENNMSYVKSSEMLHIHKNTLIYRIKQVQNKTKLDLKSPHDLSMLYLAFRFWYKA